jgi:hypothetical protein
MGKENIRAINYMESNICKYVLFFCICMMPVYGYGQKNEFAANAGLTFDGEAALGGSYRYKFSKHIGFSLKVNVYHELVEWDRNVGATASTSEQATNLVAYLSPLNYEFAFHGLAIIFEPALGVNMIPNLHTRVFYSKRTVNLSKDYYLNHNGRIFYLSFSNFAQLDLDDKQFIGLGYQLSNYDRYDNRRNTMIGDILYNSVLPKRHISFSVFISYGVRI